MVGWGTTVEKEKNTSGTQQAENGSHAVQSTGRFPSNGWLLPSPLAASSSSSRKTLNIRYHAHCFRARSPRIHPLSFRSPPPVSAAPLAFP